MPNELPQYANAVTALLPVLHDLPGKLIGIDGHDGSGKSTLGRYLAWRFNVSLIETDLFLLENKGPTYRYDEINRIIAKRLSKPRPVIIEGVSLLATLATLKREPDFLIVVRHQEYGGSEQLSDALAQYEQAYAPMSRANLVLEVSH